MIIFGKDAKRIQDAAKRIGDMLEAVKDDKLDSIKGLLGKKDGLEKDVTKLKEEVEDLKLKKKIDEEDIKHMIKIQQEQADLDYQKKVMEVEKEKQDEIAKVKDSYRDKVEAQLNKEGEKMSKMYEQILSRLPDVNVMLANQRPGVDVKVDKG